MNSSNPAPRTFALIGAAGYVAPRHLQAIKSNGGVLEAALDPSDSVGVLDSYFPQARFFTLFERFDRHIDRLRREGRPVDYVSVCSPNYLHDAHVRFALRSGADAICEKPLVLNPHNLDGLQDIERSTNRKVYTITQLRLHPAIDALKTAIATAPGRIHDVSLTYVTARGSWYYTSWKGDEAKSGGIATNIGVHFYDMLSFVFGALQSNVVHHRAIDCASGYLEYERARVRYFLSINRRDLPRQAAKTQKTSFRSVVVDGREIDFSDGFTDLHALSYKEILAGRGFTLDQVRPSVETIAAIRAAPIEPSKGAPHPFLEQVLNDEGRYQHGWPV